MDRTKEIIVNHGDEHTGTTRELLKLEQRIERSEDHTGPRGLEGRIMRLERSFSSHGHYGGKMTVPAPPGDTDPVLCFGQKFQTTDGDRVGVQQVLDWINDDTLIVVFRSVGPEK